jgi:hypothetical protein
MRAPSAPHLIAALLLASACSGDGGVIVTTQGTLTDTAPPPAATSTDTGYPLGDQATLLFTYNVETERAAIYGFFAEQHSGNPNLAECAVIDVACYPTFPNDPDSFKDFDTRADFEPLGYDTRYVGLSVGFGPYSMRYTNGEDLLHSYYYADVTQQVRQEGFPTGWWGLSWGGDGMWEAHESEEDLFVFQPVNLQRPTPGTLVRSPNGTVVPIEWEPTGDGEVYLRISQRFGIGKLYRLIDDGYFEFDVDDLGFGDSNNEEFTVTLMRWNRDLVQRKGHLIDVAAMSSASFDGSYFNIGNREPFQPAPSDTCDVAQGLPALQTGSYWGYNGPYTDTLDGSACTGGDPTISDDQFLKVVLQPKEALTADYNVYDDNAAIYAIDTCNIAEALCMGGTDDIANRNAGETITLFNPGDAPITRYLVLDGTDLDPDVEGSIYTLDVNVTQLVEPDGYDSCTEVDAAPADMAPGAYYAEVVDPWSATVNPGGGGCTGTSMPGPEVMFPITVPNGTSMNIGIEAEGADLGVYLLRDCGDLFSTPYGACSDVDLGFFQKEYFSYSNTSGADEHFTLVVDSKTELAPFFLYFNIF